MVAGQETLTESEKAQSNPPAPTERFWTAPNILTLIRIGCAPIFLAVFMLTASPASALEPWGVSRIGLLVCLGIAVISEISDFTDGMLARRFGQVSDFGKLMDPYADSLFRLTCFWCFASQAHGAWVPLWMVVVLFYRDGITSVIRTFAMHKGIVVSARLSGKVKAWVQGIVMVTLLALAALGGHDILVGGWTVAHLGHSLMWIVVAVSVFSGIEYLYANRSVFRV